MPSGNDTTNYGLLGPAPASSGWRGLLGNTDLALALLQNSGPSPVRRSTGEILGTSFLQARQMGQQRQDAEVDRAYKQALINSILKPQRKPLAVMGDNGNPTYVDEQDAIGKTPYSAMNRAEAPASIQEFQLAQSQGYKGAFEEWLRSKAQMAPLNPTVQLVNGVPTVVQPTNRAGAISTVPLSTPGAEQGAAAGLASATAAGRGGAERQQRFIDAGQDAADSISTVRRGLQLLEGVQTGGIDAAKLKASQLFGVTGADEAELSSNLGKAVLSQLRATFGAQFTEKEGQRLAEIEAGFGKSTEGNRRLLQQAEKILDRAARRGIDAAEQAGDKFSADEIRKALEFSLDPNSSKPGPARVPEQTATGPNGEKIVLRNGQWVPL